MKRCVHLSAALAALLLVLFLFPLAAYAEQPDTPDATAPAVNISGTGIVTAHNGINNLYALFDGYNKNGFSTGTNPSLSLACEDGLGSLYLCCTTLPTEFLITDNDSGIAMSAGESIYLHHFVDLTALFGYTPTSVTISFGEEPFAFSELMVFTPGTVPDTVQKWNPPADGQTDLLLLCAHGDDDQIFFAGIIPYYARELGCQVQVVYLTNHYNVLPYRVHEMLDGLWAAGADIYPVFGTFEDFLDDNRSLEKAYDTYLKYGNPRDKLLEFVVTQLRRFKPQVVVTHDFAGEYGHPQHMVCADLIAEAVTISGSPNAYPETADRYGLWDSPKTYIHLYSENQISIDLDQPLESFDGMTAFEVSKRLAFPFHSSQYKDVSYLIVPYASASVMRYSPSHYGLYRSTVGADIMKNDFFENVLTYEQQRLAEEARLEAERVAAEEEARRQAEEAQRIAREEAQAQEEEARRQEAEKLAAEQARIEEEAAHVRKMRMLLICCAAGTVSVLALLIVMLLKKRHRSYL